MVLRLGQRSGFMGLSMPFFQQCLFRRLTSNHSLIPLDRGGRNKGRVHLSFEDMWLKADGFRCLEKQWRDSYEVRGSSIFILAAKLKALNKGLKFWNKGLQGMWKFAKQMLQRMLVSGQGDGGIATFSGMEIRELTLKVEDSICLPASQIDLVF